MNRITVRSVVVAIACLSQTMSAREGDSRKFEGSWLLVAWTDTNERGETVHPYGEDAFGRIVYGPAGTMAVVLSRRVRVAGEEGGFYAYSGPFVVDEDKRTVTHHIEACTNPDWVGGDRTRRFEFLTEDRIVLRPVEGRGELIWQREK